MNPNIRVIDEVKRSMARQLRIEYPGAFYHVTSRGNQRQSIVKNDQDRRTFLDYIDKAHGKFGGIVHAYCLMDNHFHILFETPRGNLSKIMHFINTSYTIYFNGKNSRVGHLFQGRFKAILIEADSYAQVLSRYIHLNPVRAGIVSNPEEYFWSSFRDYTGRRTPHSWLKTSFILSFFGENPKKSQTGYGSYVRDDAERTAENPLIKADTSLILGSESFVERIKEKYLREKASSREIPAIKTLKDKPTLEAVRNAVEQALGQKNRFTRNAAIYLTHAKIDYSLKEIASFYKLSLSGIGFISRKMRKYLDWNIVVKNVLDNVERELLSIQRIGA